MDNQSKASNTNSLESKLKAGQVEIIFYTDPLCCWSWAFEPQWRRLQYEYDGQLNVRYCMAGMIPTWNSYHDEVNSVSRPIQMGPVWMHASQVSGMPMNTRIWMEDAPASSYPACIAVKSAQLQSSTLAEKYLRLLREEIMIKGRNIAKQEVLVDVAEQLHREDAGFNLQQFKEDLVNDNGLEAFKKDVHEVQTRSITRFPTLIIKDTSGKAVLITGYRPFPVLVEALNQVAPGLIKVNKEISIDNYKQYWKHITNVEILEATKIY